MKESVTYQAILEEGLAEGMAQGMAQGEASGKIKALREILLELGDEQFGAPGSDVCDAITSMNDPERLKALIHRVDDVGNWMELLMDDTCPGPESPC